VVADEVADQCEVLGGRPEVLDLLSVLEPRPAMPFDLRQRRAQASDVAAVRGQP
jgi:hypothetical protein